VIVVIGLIGAVAIIATLLGVQQASAPRADQPQAPSAAVPAVVAEAAPVAAETVPPIAGLAEPAWLDALSARSGVPHRALAAYTGAALRVAETDPACALGWNTLAAIGHVESGHGTIGGTVLDERGRAAPRIVGIALDGGDVDAIRDTDGGALDGDTVWDRAVGPMQFIPSTWALFAADGDGDGIADPQQIDDAALTAATYLCSVTDGPLTDADEWIAAIAAYNSTIDYNNRVARDATYYASVG
jgi:membrane-bound lytic murein transglycosylase B